MNGLYVLVQLMYFITKKKNYYKLNQNYLFNVIVNKHILTIYHYNY